MPKTCRILSASLLSLILFSPLLSAQPPAQPTAPPPEAKPVDPELAARAARFTELFNAADLENLIALFAEDAEFIDENGLLHNGKPEIRSLFEEFFKNFPKAAVDLNVESLRPLGKNLALEEGNRLITVPGEQTARATFRYMTIYSLVEGQWLISSVRETADDPPPASSDYLQPLAWLVGNWVSEDAEATVAVNYRWSEDRNYLLAEFEVRRAGEISRKTSQRIGWDPLNQRIRSWTFDADGGFSDAQWTPLENGWVIKTSAILPDGRSGSATLKLIPASKDRYTMTGADRVVGDSLDDDFEITIVRKPANPTPKNPTPPPQ